MLAEESVKTPPAGQLDLRHSGDGPSHEKVVKIQ
jgi:hypothetical protein